MEMGLSYPPAVPPLQKTFALVVAKLLLLAWTLIVLMKEAASNVYGRR